MLMSALKVTTVPRGPQNLDNVLQPASLMRLGYRVWVIARHVLQVEIDHYRVTCNKIYSLFY